MPIDVPVQYGNIETSILQGFKLFRAFKYFEVGFDEEKESPQIVSTIGCYLS